MTNTPTTTTKRKAPSKAQGAKRTTTKRTTDPERDEILTLVSKAQKDHDPAVAAQAITLSLTHESAVTVRQAEMTVRSWVLTGEAIIALDDGDR